MIISRIIRAVSASSMLGDVGSEAIDSGWTGLKSLVSQHVEGSEAEFVFTYDSHLGL